MRIIHLVARSALAALLIVAPAPVLVAQATSEPTVRVGRNVLSINPLGIPFEYVAAEYEGAVAGPYTLGANFSYFSPGDESYTSFEVKGRLYPNERGPNGFAVGLGLGVSRVSDVRSCFDCGSISATRPTVHVFADYNWLLGRSERFFVGTGVGAKRVFGINGDDYSDILEVYPTVRFQIGARF